MYLPALYLYVRVHMLSMCVFVCVCICGCVFIWAGWGEGVSRGHRLTMSLDTVDLGESVERLGQGQVEDREQGV